MIIGVQREAFHDDSIGYEVGRYVQRHHIINGLFKRSRCPSKRVSFTLNYGGQVMIISYNSYINSFSASFDTEGVQTSLHNYLVRWNLHPINQILYGSLTNILFRSQRDIHLPDWIKEGIPVSYRQGQSERFFNGKENERIPGKREEEHFDTDDLKLEFLQRYGWLIDDDEVRAYSAKYKPNR